MALLNDMLGALIEVGSTSYLQFSLHEAMRAIAIGHLLPHRATHPRKILPLLMSGRKSEEAEELLRDLFSTLCHEEWTGSTFLSNAARGGNLSFLRSRAPSQSSRTAQETTEGTMDSSRGASFKVAVNSGLNLESEICEWRHCHSKEHHRSCSLQKPLLT